MAGVAPERLDLPGISLQLREQLRLDHRSIESDWPANPAAHDVDPLDRQPEEQRDVDQQLRHVVAEAFGDQVKTNTVALAGFNDDELCDLAELAWLHGATPREAAKTASGRERLEALFLQFEQYNESPQPFSPDVASLRHALRLS